MNLRTLLYILPIILLLASCTERVELVPSEEGKLNLECVLVPGQEITATVSTVSDFSQIDNIVYPDNARLYLVTDIDTPIEFQWDETRQLYFVPKWFFTPIPSYTKYEIHGYLLDNEEKEIVSPSRFKSPVHFINSANTTSNIELSDNGFEIQTFLRTNGTISSDRSFYKLNAFYKTVDATGNFSAQIPLEFTYNSKDPLAFFQNDYTNGVYINLNRVDFSNFDMNFRLPADVTDLDQISDNIYLSISTINEEVYKYEVAKCKRISSLYTGSSDPVMSYTNVNNGFGIFGTSITVTDSILIK